uniref:Uncharacterized protein n=1 Tax=Strigamia maritima TaxID=126957 RepID=T1INV5_STRMM
METKEYETLERMEGWKEYIVGTSAMGWTHFYNFTNEINEIKKFLHFFFLKIFVDGDGGNCVVGGLNLKYKIYVTS